MSCSNNITPCGCGNNPCGCGTSSDDVVYQGPNLSCTGVSNCDTVTEAIETIDGFICGPGMVQNIINNILNNTNLYNQFTTIVNNTVDCQTVWNCYNSSTTTTTTTLCRCTYYQHVAVTQFPGTFTYVECDTREVITVTSGGEVDTVCVDNNYPTIEVGKINVLNTGVCCSVITTTTTTTLFIQSFCNEVTATGTVYIYWTNSNGYSEVMKIQNETVYICAQVGSIAFTGSGSISVVGSPTTCISDGECAPTTTSTTTLSLPCVSYNLEASGPSGSPGETDWEAVECNTNITVGGTIVYPNVVNTGCITDGSLLLGPKVIIVDSEPCPTTTTTTTLIPPSTTTTTTTAITSICFCIFGEGVGCEYTEELPILGNAPFQNGRPVYDIGGDLPGTLYWDGSQWIYASQDLAPLLQPLLNSNYYPIGTYSEWGDAAITGLMNSSTSGPCPPSTTTTTTTIAPCVQWTWEAIGANSSNLEYTDCDGLPVVIPIIDVTNNSGIICVYPSVTPEWNPGPTLGTHIISTVGANCPTTTTTTTFVPCTIWSWEAIGFNTSGISYVDCNGQDVYIDPDDITNNSGDICVYPGNTPEWSPAPLGGTHILGTVGDECIAPSTTTTTTTEPVPTYCYSLSAVGKVTFYWIDVNGIAQTITITNNITYVCAQLDSVVAIGLAEIEGGITPCTNNSQCVPTTTTTSSSSSTTTTTTTAAPYLKLTLDANSDGSLLGACGVIYSADLNIYVENGIPVNGGFIYEDLALTIPFAGNNKFYKVQLIDSSFMAVEVSATGEILSSLTC